MAPVLTGGCNCGAVRYTAEGPPLRTGLCHCQTCRRETGSHGMWFGVWNRGAVSISGETSSWTERTETRHFCPRCGSRLFATSDDEEIEIRLGTLDQAPSKLRPDYELWIVRREHWAEPLAGTAQYPGNRSEG
ncbi:GFA family protein [Phreatobacter stygius]|uniref:GFA family protein n=1 Tax=Phreatobacter stygius TaxID=1940610 RepID=A0A4D7BHA3_9HYPH|nr:GFA family protein [Phreatobacter stygius]QCI68516.1 GFA family protein [Phreatobacter stygius]